jgi:hypothetical protein
MLNKKIIALALVIVFSLVGCSTISKVANTIANFKSLQFKLGEVNNFAVSNVNLSKIKNISDVSIADGLALTRAFSNKQLPVNFTLNVVASNPNSNSVKANQKSNFDALISSLDWTLLIDDKNTVNGTITQPITIPTGNQNTIIPVSIGLDLFKFFNDKNYNDIINLALAIGGANGSSSRLKLKIRPTVSIAGFPVSYPDFITVIDKEFRDK